MRFIRRVVTQCDAAHVPVGICGEMGGKPLEAMALIGVGVERLSITPAAIGPVKAMVRSLDVPALRTAMTELLTAPPRDMRGALQQWAEAHQVRIS